MKQCVFCGKQFEEHQSNPNKKKTKYCSTQCSQSAAVKRNTENRRKLNLGARLGLSGGKIAKITQTVVAIDLIKRGWEVYTAFEDTHPFDILAIKGFSLKKIEVKSANILPSGRRIVTDPKGKVKNGDYEIVASVDNLINIVYSPDISRWDKV